MVETELRNSLPGQSLLVPCDRQLKMGTQGLCISSTTVCDVKSQGNTQEMSLDGTSKFEKLLDKSAEGPSSLQGRQAKLEQLEQSLAATSKLLPNVLEACVENTDAATLQKTVKLPSSTRSPPSTLKEALSVLKEAAGVSGVQLTEAPVPDLKGADEQTKTLKGNIAGEAVNQDVDLDSSLMEASKVEEPSTSFQASGGLLDADVAELRALLETAIQESGSNEVALDDDRTVKFEVPAERVLVIAKAGGDLDVTQLMTAREVMDHVLACAAVHLSWLEALPHAYLFSVDDGAQAHAIDELLTTQIPLEVENQEVEVGLLPVALGGSNAPQNALESALARFPVATSEDQEAKPYKVVLCHYFESSDYHRRQRPDRSRALSGGRVAAAATEAAAHLRTRLQVSGRGKYGRDASDSKCRRLHRAFALSSTTLNIHRRTKQLPQAPAKNVGISGPCPAEVTPRQLTRGMVPAALAEDLYDSSRSQNSQSAGPCRSHSALSCASWMASSVGDSLEFSRSSVGYAVGEEGKLQEASVGSSPSRGGQDASVTAVSVDSTQLKANFKPSSAVSALIMKLAGIYQRCAERPWAWTCRRNCLNFWAVCQAVDVLASPQLCSKLEAMIHPPAMGGPVLSARASRIHLDRDADSILEARRARKSSFDPMAVQKRGDVDAFRKQQEEALLRMAEMKEQKRLEKKQKKMAEKGEKPKKEKKVKKKKGILSASLGAAARLSWLAVSLAGKKDKKKKDKKKKKEKKKKLLGQGECFSKHLIYVTELLSEEQAGIEFEVVLFLRWSWMAWWDLDDGNQVAPGDICAAVFYSHLRTYEDVMLSDLSLVDYIAVNKAAQSFLPHTQGRYQMRRFRKALCPIVERLCCSIMMHGRNNGKKLMAVRIVKHAFEIIHLLTDKNPIQVFVDAVKNGGPREDSTRVGSAGVVRRQAVDVSPLRRVNQAIYLICTGARNSAFRNIKSISECLADEIMNAAKESSNSYAIKKKENACLSGQPLSDVEPLANLRAVGSEGPVRDRAQYRTYEDVMLSDLSLVDYIAVNKAAQSFLPHTQGRYQMRRFRKALCPIVERLCCSIMMHGRNNGKKLMAVRIVKHAFEIIHLLTDKNPIQVFVDAVKNGGPREDSTRVGSAGVVRRQAVDVSPLRRVNQAIYLICTGARNSAFRNIKSISECLADEIMNAAKESSNSYAIKKKDEIERVAKANR
ncbi:RPS5B [Symbiodinium sp. CCMP2592]|nr:RPS5B [Symbiodinium sp. CCMP2592]